MRYKLYARVQHTTYRICARCVRAYAPTLGDSVACFLFIGNLIVNAQIDLTMTMWVIHRECASRPVTYMFCVFVC